MSIPAQETQLRIQNVDTRHRCETRAVKESHSLLFVTLLGGLFLTWAAPDQASGTGESTEDKTQQKQAALDLRRVWKFDQDMRGRLPAGFSVQTVGHGQRGVWRVEANSEAPSAPNVLVQTASCESEGCFQILLANGVTYDYVDLAFRLRSPSESASGVAGAVFGVRDARNFYAVLVDLSKDTLSVLRVLDGNETVLGSAPIKRKGSDWHHVRVARNTIISKEFIEAFFDHRLTVSVQDQTLGRGQIGLVTRGEIPIAFDNIHVIRLYSQRPLSGPAAY